MKSGTVSFYNTFSIFYPLVDLFLKPQKRFLIQEINRYPEGKLLEIGIGNGSHLPLYKKHRITGIDTSSKMLTAAARRINKDIELLVMNGENLDFQKESFDYVVLSHVIAVVGNPEQLLEEVYRVLKPNGIVFVLNHFTPNNWLKYVDHSLEWASKKFHFRSVFYLSNLRTVEKFSLLREFQFGSFSYFKLLIFRRNEKD